MSGSDIEDRGRRSRRLCLRLALVLLAAALVTSACATRERLAHPAIRVVGPGTAHIGTECRPQIRVMTLNLAHARGEGLHQLLQNRATAVRNLDRIGEMLEREAPDLVAVQELDGPSFWSGGLDHLDYLAGRPRFHQFVRAEHVGGPGLSYGTGLLASLPLSDPLAVTFEPVPLHPAKGFVVSSFRWPGRGDLWVDVASVHLNPLSPEARKTQARALVQVLRQRGRPLILMGDFNTDWQHRDSVLRWLGAELGLRAYRPEARDLTSFPVLKRRLDWILVSRELEFRGYRVPSDAVSDHRAVVADVTLHYPQKGFGARPTAPGKCLPKAVTRIWPLPGRPRPAFRLSA